MFGNNENGCIFTSSKQLSGDKNCQKMKDNRKTYNNQKVEANGNVARFDGKYDPATKTLKVYRYYGDITILEEAMQNFAIDNGIQTVVVI